MCWSAIRANRSRRRSSRGCNTAALPTATTATMAIHRRAVNRGSRMIRAPSGRNVRVNYDSPDALNRATHSDRSAFSRGRTRPKCQTHSTDKDARIIAVH